MLYNRKSFLFILIAPSGAGKSTIVNRILDECNDFTYSISYTTRNPRENEINGENYFFISKEDFKKKIENGDFLEYAEVHGNMYGTSKSFIKKQFDKDKNVILDVDVQGAKLIGKSGFDHVSVFILPPTIYILKNRLRNRATDSDEQINIRLKNAKTEIGMLHNFQYLVINDDLDKAVNEIKKIISAEKNKIIRYDNILDTFYGGSK